MTESKALIGKVIWFSKGIGFVKPDQESVNGGKDLFVHYSNIEMEGFKQLKPEQVVSFELGVNDRGPQAVKVKVLKDAPKEEATDELDTF